jgi:predicted CXXCH cytochrome family protein
MGSAHDFSGAGWNTSGESCVCHITHNGDTTLEAPLWDHQITAVTDYGVYDISPTLDATVGQPGETSLLCLSCHDGTVAVDAFGDTPTSTFTLDASSTAYVGQDLSNDHPIGFAYDTALSTADPGLYDPSSTDAGVSERPGNIDVALLFGPGDDQMECASCHDPHAAAGVANFLRKDNAASALCLTCHDK